MFDNENDNEIENESGVENTEVSQEPQDESQTESEQGQEAAQQASEQEKPLPFNEHPRWKEMLEQRNAERQAREQLQSQIAEMQKRFEELSKPKDNKPDFNQVRTKMAERLKNIDPEFQQYMSLLEQQALSAQEKLEAFEEKQLVQSLTSKFEDLVAKAGLSPEDKDLYFSKMDSAYRTGKLRSASDVESMFKAIHDPQQKRIDAIKKAAIEEYVKTKKADAVKPAAQPKGRQATPGKGQKVYQNDQQRKADLVSQIVTEMRASNDPL